MEKQNSMENKLRIELSREAIAKMIKPVILLNSDDFDDIKKNVEDQTTIIMSDKPTYMNVHVKVHALLARGQFVVYDSFGQYEPSLQTKLKANQNKMENNTEQTTQQGPQLHKRSAVHRTLFILKNCKAYWYWRAKKNGKKFKEYYRGPGYYIAIGCLGHNPIGQKWVTQMQSGKIGIYELVAYTTYRDPYDMVESSYWNFIGHQGVKPIHECSFEEFFFWYCGFSL
jgi:hypothetical protein